MIAAEYVSGTQILGFTQDIVRDEKDCHSHPTVLRRIFLQPWPCLSEMWELWVEQWNVLQKSQEPHNPPIIYSDGQPKSQSCFAASNASGANILSVHFYIKYETLIQIKIIEGCIEQSWFKWIFCF